ncbi:hypothetical protein JCM3770_007100 [Rhodotorula araucariae]
MPFFTSKRRKSEANLRSRTHVAPPPPVVPELPPSLPAPARLSVFGLDSISFSSPPSAPHMTRRRSQSATRVLDGAAARPEREPAQAQALPQAQGRAAPPRSASTRAWDDIAPEPSSIPPLALHSAALNGTGGYAPPPRRDSSFASTATVSSSATSPSRGSRGAVRPAGRMAKSPTPPTSDGGHEPFGLMDHGALDHAHTLRSSFDGLVDSPPVSIAARPPPPGSQRRAYDSSPRLPPSPSFYGPEGSALPTQFQPQLQQGVHRPQALLPGSAHHPQQQLGTGARRERATSDGTSEGEAYGVAKLPRENPQAETSHNPTLAMSTEAISLATDSHSPASTIVPNHSLGLSSSHIPNTSPTVSPPLRGAYDPLAAFHGAPSPALSGGSSSPSTDTTPNRSPMARFNRQPSNESGGDGNATTPGASDSDHSDIGPMRRQAKGPHPTVLQPPLQLDAYTPSPSPQRSRSSNPSASTDATYTPVKAAQSAVARPPSPQPPHAGVASHSSPIANRSPREERAALAPPRSSEVFGSSAPKDSPRRLIKKRSPSAAPPPAPSAQPFSRAPVPPALSSSSANEKTRAARPVTPPKSPERARHAASAAGEAGAAARSLPPRRSSLAVRSHANAAGAEVPHNIVPPPLLVSPRSPATSPTVPHSEGPSTPRSTAHPPTSPSRRVHPGVETTPRAAALAAARQREKLAAREAPADAAIIPNVPLPPPSLAGASAVQVVEDRPLKPRMEYTFATYPVAVLKALLPHLNYANVVSLRLVSRAVARAIEVEGKDLVLERFLGAHGYRSLTRTAKLGKAAYLPENEITLDLRDLSAFRAALRTTADEYAHLARAYTHDPARFPPSQLRLARASTRAWNRVVLRLRLQTALAPTYLAPPAFPDLASVSAPAYKSGRAASLRVWVPTRVGESWMSDAEVVECEREVWRSSGAWAQLRKGDVVANVAVPTFGNVGMLIFDGKFLRDLSFEFDVVGHLPAWLNMLEFSPSHFHNIVVASSSSPVFYLSLAPYVAAVRETITLCKERVELSSPQGSYLVSRYVYRAALKVHAGQIIGDAAGQGGAGPGGIEVVHPDWAGQIVVEVEGTTEAATLLLARVASVEPAPWHIVREKSRLGRIWLRPVLDGESA